MPEIERRMVEMEFRADGEAEQPVISGRAAVYNRWSEDLGGFREIIEPGFFENVLKDDVRALWNHNPDLVLGRTRAGTLALADTESSLDVTIKPPDTQIGRDAVVSIKRRDVTQMSFAFSVRSGGDAWERDQKNGAITRRLLRGGCERMYDVSPVTYPAYAQTSVHARSMMDELNTQAGQEPDLELSDHPGVAQEAEEEKRAQARARHANRIRLLDIKKRL
jgi:HK97 family phage prohead protease